jgi:hypothetical protein
MSVYCSTGKAFLQVCDQVEHSILLLLSAGILRATVLIQAAYVAHADGVTVLAFGVSTDLFEGATLFDGAIQTDKVMIANT